MNCGMKLQNIGTCKKKGTCQNMDCQGSSRVNFMQTKRIYFRKKAGHRIVLEN